MNRKKTDWKEETEIERELRGEINEAVFRKLWENQAETEIEENKEDLARHAKYITDNKYKALKIKAENATKMMNDSNKELKQCQNNDSVTPKVPRECWL